MFFAVCLGVFLYLFWPAEAYAYLDPGTGNSLAYIIISLMSAIIFSLKSLFYAIFGKKSKVLGSKDRNHDIVIVSEGKSYWYTFKEVVKTLIDRKQKFTYYSMDINDPGLMLDNEYISNKYIGKNKMSFLKLSNLKANIMLSSTPNIGCDNYPIARSKNIKNLVHVFHAVDGLAYYQKGSLDHYDSVMLVGGFEIPIIRKLEKLRNLKEKELYPAGLPYLDELFKKLDRRKICEVDHKDNKDNSKTILVAPSWGSKSCLVKYGYGFIRDLAVLGYKIIVRIHPQSLIAEKNFIDDTRKRLLKYKNVVWDFNVDSSSSMEEADILISDTSGIRFDFVLLYQKPVITLSVGLEDVYRYELDDLKESWAEQVAKDFGEVIDENNIHDICNVVRKVMDNVERYDLSKFRNSIVYNLGESGSIIADYLINKNNEYNQNYKE